MTESGDQSPDGQLAKTSRERSRFNTASSEALRLLREQIRNKFESRDDAWLTMDENKDSQISIQEFRLFLNTEFHINNSEFVHSLFCEIDEDGDGSISLTEFKARVQDHIKLPGGSQKKVGMGKFSRRHSSAEMMPVPAKEEPSLDNVRQRRYSLGDKHDLSLLGSADEAGSDEHKGVQVKQTKVRKPTKALKQKIDGHK